MNTKNNYTGITYARQCDECRKGMNDGYVICNGEGYYCTDECLHKHYTEEQWNEMYNDDDGESYYTEWDKDDHMYRELADGTLEEIE
jgi:hypothetical protein